jgi:hypothetical protein
MMIACFKIDLRMHHEDSIYRYPRGAGDVFLTKSPGDILIVEPFLRIMPNLYVIYMLRDPRDTIVSKHGKSPDRYWASLTFWKTWTPYGRRLQSHPRFITVRYEDLVTQPDQVQDCLIKRMPFLKKKASFSRYHELTHPPADSLNALCGVRPASRSSIGNWRRHLPRVAGQLQRHGSISKDLIEYGYEKDDAWERELEGIQPDMSESDRPEYFTKEMLRRKTRIKHLKAVLVVFLNSNFAMKLRGALVQVEGSISPLLRLFEHRDKKAVEPLVQRDEKARQL